MIGCGIFFVPAFEEGKVFVRACRICEHWTTNELPEIRPPNGPALSHDPGLAVLLLPAGPPASETAPATMRSGALEV